MYERDQLINTGCGTATAAGQAHISRGYSENAVKPAPPRDKSTMDMVVDTLASHVSAAEMLFQGLGDKLKPILSTSDTAYGNEQIRPSSCELEERILNLASRIANLNASMNDINARVCL